VLVAKVRLFPSSDQRQQVLATLRSVQGPTQVKPHCLASQIYEESGQLESILYLEEWDSEPEFGEHVRSELYRRILAAIDLSSTLPELCFYHISGLQGLDLVQQIRETSAGVAGADHDL
jgi:quinol monooxygenase YgiN